MTDNRLIVALDVSTIEEVKQIVEELGETVSYYKVGMELFYSIGKEVLEYLSEQKKDIFLDLKLHDIPNTVAEGLFALINANISMLNVHASGGYTMMKTAVDKLRLESQKLGINPPKLIAVTVLTSIGDEEWKQLGFEIPISEQVIRLAKLAKLAGLDGVVASPHEAKSIREVCGNEFLIVTPGIRPIGTSVDDQNRITTPKVAFLNGASHIVVGRPIRNAQNPRKMAQDIILDIRGV